MIRMILVLSGLIVATAPTCAQEVPAESPLAQTAPAETPLGEKPSAESGPGNDLDSRYTFSRVQDGYVRLDNRTGKVSFCSKRAVGWACQLVPEDRSAYENEIARLQEENAALKKDLLTPGLSLPSGVKPAAPPPPAQGDKPASKLPNDANFERVRTFAEKLWGRLVDMVAKLQKGRAE
ncbi:MAG: hypothetical protein QOD40_348 [Alphaproteobacteria bacterium]|jgi:hypothetical protein|nr:hypothetical protein [Alphaproteobacteria bacterium]